MRVLNLILILSYMLIADTKVVSNPQHNIYHTYGEYSMGRADSIMMVKQYLSNEARDAVLEHLSILVESQVLQYSNLDLGKKTEIKTKIIKPALTALKVLEEGYVKEGIYFVKYEVNVDQDSIFRDIDIATKKYDRVLATPTSKNLTELQQTILFKERERLEKTQEYKESEAYAFEVVSSIVNSAYMNNMTVYHNIVETQTHDMSYDRYYGEKNRPWIMKVERVEKKRISAVIDSIYTIDEKGYEEVRELMPNNKVVSTVGNFIAGVLTLGLSAITDKFYLGNGAYGQYNSIFFNCRQTNLISDLDITMIYEVTTTKDKQRIVDRVNIGQCTKFVITQKINDVETELPLEVIGFEVVAPKAYQTY